MPADRHPPECVCTEIGPYDGSIGLVGPTAEGPPPIWINEACPVHGKPTMPADSRYMVLVPREPTPEMIRKGAWRAKLAHDANPGDTWEYLARETFAVMLSASPARGEAANALGESASVGPDKATPSTSVDATPKVAQQAGGGTPHPSPGEGDAPVAWPEIVWWDGAKGPPERLAESLEGYSRNRPAEHRLLWSMEAAAKFIREVTSQPLYTRPAPATPEGLREKVAAHLHDRYAEMAGLERYEDLSSLDKENWRIEADAILSALQPQADGGSR